MARSGKLLVCTHEGREFWEWCDRLLPVGWMTEVERSDYLLHTDRLQELLQSWRRSRWQSVLTRRGRLLGFLDVVEIVRARMGL
jgi:hypothetical protein